MKRATSERYVVCVEANSTMDLVVRRIYEVLPDESAARDDFIRVVDESGEHYLSPASFFAPIDVPEGSARAVRDAAKRRSRAAR